MKTLKRIPFLLLCLCLPFAGLAKKQRFDRTYSERYEVQSDAIVNVRSSFSELNVQSVPGNTVTIEVRVEVDAASAEKAQKLLDRLKVTMKGSRNEVSVTTDTGSEWNNKGENFKIIVTVKAPAGNQLDVDHQFGSATIGDFSGTAKLNSGFGSMTVGKLTGNDNTVKSSYGKTQINTAASGNYQSEFGELRIAALNGNAQLRCSFGNLNVDLVNATVTTLHVNNEFGETQLTLAANASFLVEAQSGFGDVDLPRDARIISDKEALTSRSIDAEIGQQSQNRLTITNSFGEVNVKRQ